MTKDFVRRYRIETAKSEHNFRLKEKKTYRHERKEKRKERTVTGFQSVGRVNFTHVE